MTCFGDHLPGAGGFEASASLMALSRARSRSIAARSRTAGSSSMRSPSFRRVHAADGELRLLLDRAAGELDGGLDVRRIGVRDRLQLDVADVRAGAGEDLFRIGQFRAAV